MIPCFVLTDIGAGNILYDLKKRIQHAQDDLNRLDSPPAHIPELISSANLVRKNDYLAKSDQKKTELLSLYSQYSKALEEFLSSVFDIQKDLKEIVKEQSAMISDQRKNPSKLKTKAKTKKR